MPLPQPKWVEVPKIFKGTRPGIDEKKSAWVAFPHLRCQYLLPIVQLNRKLVPVFYEDGSVGVESIDRDEELAAMVEKFAWSITRDEAKERKLLFGLERYTSFMALVKALLLKNYDLTNEQLAPMLTMTQDQLTAFIQVIWRHCAGA